MNHLYRTLRSRYPPSMSVWYLVLSLSQFHIPYYAGRTMPNFLALPLGKPYLPVAYAWLTQG